MHEPSLTPPRLSIATLTLAAVLAAAAPFHAQAALGGSAGQSYASPSPAFEGGGQVYAVSVILEGSTGDSARDLRIREDAAVAVGIRAGDSVDPGAPLLALQRLREIDGVADAEFRTQTGPIGTSLVFVVKAAAAEVRSELALPRLHEDSKSMVKLILNGGLGIYSDGNAFFRNWNAFNRGSPIAPGPATGARVTFSDISIEAGIGGIAEVGHKLHAYSAATLLASGTWGPDIYQRNDSMHVAVEKAYAGLLWTPEKDKTMNVSLGRQNYTLNDGFLIHHVKGSTNVGERRAVFLGARTAHDMTVLLNARYEQWGFKLFHLDPNEYEPLESNTRFAGGNLRYNFGHGLSVDGTHIENVRSDSSFATPQGARIPREGIATTAVHLLWRNALKVPGLFLESELARQGSSRADVSASAGYGSLGYRWNDIKWKPAFVVRYAQWSGDRPETARYERWDPLLPAGSDEWMGGMTFSKYVSNSNLQQLRIRLFAEPAKNFNFTVDWFRYQALETNNLGANRVLSTLQSRDLGDELMFTGRWFIGKNYYVQTLASINWPGEGIRRALPEPTKPWTTLQATLYWFF